MIMNIRRLFILLAGFLSTAAVADVFENPLPECFKVRRVIDGKIFVLNSDSKEQLLDLGDANPRRDKIIQKAQEAIAANKLLCGSVRGLSIKSDDSQPSAGLSGKELENFCWEKREQYQKSKGWTGLLNTKQYNEVEDFQAECMITKGKSAPESREDKIDRYNACRSQADKASADCGSSADPKSCIQNYLGRQKPAFKNEIDFVVLPLPPGKYTVQCRMDGHAPSRRELDAPTRQGPKDLEQGSPRGVR
jgi:hypothetical protein